MPFPFRGIKIPVPVNIISVCIFFLLIFPLLAAGSEKADNCLTCGKPDPGFACLHVVVKGMEKATGVVRLSLYDREETYDLRQHSCRYSVMPVRSDEDGAPFAEEKFNNLKPGWYAILLFHDSNNNGEFDMFLGIPKERFGFSNNVRPGITGTPAFDETKFLLEADRCKTVTIRLQSLFGP